MSTSSNIQVQCQDDVYDADVFDANEDPQDVVDYASEEEVIVNNLQIDWISLILSLPSVIQVAEADEYLEEDEGLEDIFEEEIIAEEPIVEEPLVEEPVVEEAIEDIQENTLTETETEDILPPQPKKVGIFKRFAKSFFRQQRDDRESYRDNIIFLINFLHTKQQ